MRLSDSEIEQFNNDGYLIKRKLIDMALLNDLRNQVKIQLQLRLPPFELEAEVGYPKAPESVAAEGGLTIRRLLLAFSRDTSFREWAKNKVVKNILQQLLDSADVYLVQSHHNCIMTKQPQYSSQTGWHRDIRYWKFSDDLLINSWLAMGDENNANGCLKVLPGSHELKVANDMVDKDLFLNQQHPQAKAWLDAAVDVELSAGDVLFFHAGLFHAANNNQTDQAKFSLVNSYHGAGNFPLENSKSTSYEEILI
ncbi:phytanoyl-CoA dioxygenase family protein [Marinicella litoralis]|uniref:Phytanoyl-CoA hydroxylase n=1 Tax=Marinicella litoralis TaxID=644220 RepID=A0A4R6XJG3_9GAMM|nr:phytanoyl-CoA dioxygenase family protein [Marinicella litoralis]TDR18489.1 phytanoyl-CoA hydroxylase [Marinicella litoralis]